MPTETEVRLNAHDFESFRVAVASTVSVPRRQDGELIRVVEIGEDGTPTQRWMVFERHDPAEGIAIGHLGPVVRRRWPPVASGDPPRPGGEKSGSPVDAAIEAEYGEPKGG